VFLGLFGPKSEWQRAKTPLPSILPSINLGRKRLRFAGVYTAKSFAKIFCKNFSILFMPISVYLSTRAQVGIRYIHRRIRYWDDKYKKLFTKFLGRYWEGKKPAICGKSQYLYGRFAKICQDFLKKESCGSPRKAVSVARGMC
jgi:hypothetical protein